MPTARTVPAGARGLAACGLAVVFATLAAPLAFRSVTAAEQKPNVLLITVDDLNTAPGCSGNPQVESPNLDHVAARGVVFRHAHRQ